MIDERPTAPTFIELYEPVASAIYTWARLHIHAPLRRRVDPEDVLQEVCYRAFNRFATFDPETAKFRSWLFGIANNVLRECLRSLRTRGESVFAGATHTTQAGLDGVAGDATSISTRVARQEDLQRFLARIEDLDEEDRRLILYRGLEGKRHHEVADLLGIKPEAAEKRWQRLRNRLQEEGLPRGLQLT